MKKLTIGAGILTAMLLFSPIVGNPVDASVLANASTQKEKVMWGANELYDYQIGRLVFTKDVKVYKRDANGAVQFHMNAKKGSMWRVHKITKEGNMNVYDLGAGVRVQQSSLSKYESAPKELVAKQVKQNNNGAFLVWEQQRYNLPQVHKIVSEDAKNKINENIKLIFHGFATTLEVSDINIIILENRDNRLIMEFNYKIANYDTGESSNGSFPMIYDLTTGKAIE